MEKLKWQSINPKKEELTIEKLRELTGKNYSDEQAQELVFTIKQFVHIIMKYQLKKEKEKLLGQQYN